MSCVFASNSDSPGCRFILTVGNVSELFDLLRATVDSTSVTQCNQTMNQGEVYGTITVVDIQRTGENGRLALQFMASSLPNSSSYIETTSCSIPSPPTALSTGMQLMSTISSALFGYQVCLSYFTIYVTGSRKRDHFADLLESRYRRLNSDTTT